MKILVINSGSSSLKYQLIDTESGDVLAKGYYERIGIGGAFLTHKINGEKYKLEHDVDNHTDALKFTIEQLLNPEYPAIKSLDEIDAIGHRVVHGGDKIKSSKLINDEVISVIEECIPLAPLHNPAGLTGIKACQDALPGKPNVAVFDTAFHHTIKPAQYTYAIPYRFYEKYGVRKYGFHGMSHNYIANRISELTGRKDLKVINCHLGQGASLCAIKNGESVDTSMGFTPLAGIPMGSRCGDLDPSIVTFIMKKEGLTPDEMDKVMNKESGIFGISEISPDFRDVEDAAWKNGDAKANLAMDVYFYAVAKKIAEYMVALQGVDVITFTAGVGENGSEDREEICKLLKCFGVEIDPEANKVRGKEAKISTPNSKIEVWVVPTNEELFIAKETEKIVKEN